MRTCLLPLGITLALMGLTHAFQPWSEHWLIFYRPELPAQVWRFLTASLCHTNTNHLLVNSLGLVIIWLLFKRHFNWLNLTSLLILTSLAVGLTLWLFDPDVVWYVGLSGTLHGLFCYGACKDVECKIRFGWLLCIGVAIKLALEQWGPPQQAMAEMIDANVLVNAHLYGAIAGVAYYFGMRYLTGQKTKLSPD
ncbi:rhombosortase [Motilimonas eburnea]|nr:rhombosortase [Motilimonas eburnea]